MNVEATEMTSDELWEEVGEMISRGEREEVEPKQAKKRFRDWLREKAAGGSPEDLSVETIYALGEDEADSRMPDDITNLLGLKPRALYGDIFNAEPYARDRRKEREGTLQLKK